MTAKPSYEELERRVQELEIIKSEYKHLLEIYQKNENLFKRLFEKAPLGYQSLDENGDFLVVNSTWLDTLGYAKEEVIGKSFADFLHPDCRDHFKENFPRFKSIGEVLGIEFEMVKKNGDLILVSFTGKISRDKQGEFQQTHCIFHDITERKQAEETKAKLESVNRQIQKAESLGRMAGAIAHHFNNKLQVVNGFLELALDDPQLSDPSKYKLNKAMQASGQAAEVSKMMLTYLGNTVEKREPLNLSEICRMSFPLIQAAMPKNLVLETHLPSPGPVIEANAKQIQQILTNLVTNALEAIGVNNGSINVTVKTASMAEITSSHRFPVNWQPHNIPYACLEVRDNGCGIADQDLEEIFSPFFSTKFTGRGMGLPVVLGLVQAHRGVVTAESQPGLGSVFRVFLPISGEESIKQWQKETKAPVIEQTGKVLLVDDDMIVLELTSVMLSTLNFTVLRAKDGIEALEVFRQHKDEIRFVLSDVAMPRMNGWDTLLALRRINPNIRVILASGYSEEQVMMNGIYPQLPQAFLGKPYGFEDLKDAISRALAENR